VRSAKWLTLPERYAHILQKNKVGGSHLLLAPASSPTGRQRRDRGRRFALNKSSVFDIASSISILDCFLFFEPLVSK
jgi:hypothetical protein